MGQIAIPVELSRWGFRNYLINGNFVLNQRAAAFSNPSGVYTFDQWLWSIGTGGGAAGSATRTAFTLGQTDVPGEPSYYIAHAQTTGSTVNAPTISQRIEGVRTLAGQQSTLSFWAKVTSGTLTVSPTIVQSFGTGGSPSANVSTGGANQTITTTWQRFVVPITIPSISGKTLGTAGDDWMGPVLFLPLSTTFTLYVANVQLEYGEYASPFENRPLVDELMLAQRYYAKSYNLFVAPGTASAWDGSLEYRSHIANQGYLEGMRSDFPVRMRITPAMTWYSPSTGTSARVYDSSTAADLIVAASTYIGEMNTGFPSVAGSTSNAGDLMLVNWVANAEI